MNNNKNDYDKYYDTNTYLDWENAPGKSVLLNAILKLALNPTIYRVLDIGCGTGYFLNRVIEETNINIESYGIDLSKNAILFGQSKYPHLNLQEGDAHNLNWDNDFFDIIISYGSFEHFINPRLAIKNASLTLKHGGLFLTMQPTLGIYRSDEKGEGWYRETDEAGQMQWNYYRKTWEEFFTESKIELLDDKFAYECGAIKPGNFYFGNKR